MLFIKIFLYEKFSYPKILEEVYYVISLILATFAFY